MNYNPGDLPMGEDYAADPNGPSAGSYHQAAGYGQAPSPGQYYSKRSSSSSQTGIPALNVSGRTFGDGTASPYRVHSGHSSPTRHHRHPSYYGDANEFSTMNPAYPVSPHTPTRRRHSQQQSLSDSLGSPSAAATQPPPAFMYNGANGAAAASKSQRTSQLFIPTSVHPPSSAPASANPYSGMAPLPGTPLAGTPLAGTPTRYMQAGLMEPQSPLRTLPAPKIPSIRRVTSKSQLLPVKVQNPKYRRALPDGGFVSPLMAVTTCLTSTYHICDPAFDYNLSKKPRRVLTEPREAKLNNGYDNEESDYILLVHDVLGTDENRRYLVLNVLGKGTFGQVVKCQNMATKEVVAIKVIKNKPAYLNQSLMEVSILEHIQNNVDKDDKHNLLQLKDKFVHKEHLCLVFELLSSNLYEVIKKKQFRGLDIRLVRTFAQQMLDSLAVLKEARLIHCDLKPENVLLKRNDSTAIKIIDFGSACHERQTVYTYIQSRFYRSPEVILGLPYTSSIDMWSMGCIIAELFLGLPIFPGTSEYNQWSRIVASLGMPPNWMIEMGKNSSHFVKKYTDDGGHRRYRLRTLEEQMAEFGGEEKPSKQYFNSTDIREIIMTYPLMSGNMSQDEIDAEMHQREALADFIKGLLNFNPFERWTPQQAAMHPFVTGKQFLGPFVPTMPAAPATPQNHAQVPSQAQPQPSQPVPAPVQASQSYPIPQPMQPMPMPQPVMAAGQPMMIPTANMVPGHPSLLQPMGAVGGGFGIGQPVTPNGGLQAGPAQRRRMRAATIGQPDPVPQPLQRAAAMVNPANVIRAQASPAYHPPPEIYQQQQRRYAPSQFSRGQGYPQDRLA